MAETLAAYDVDTREKIASAGAIADRLRLKQTPGYPVFKTEYSKALLRANS